MRRGLLATLRITRRWFAHVVMLALVLPVLIALLPQPALSASAALDRDVLLSVCGQSGPQQGGGARHQGVHDHCILCNSGCSTCSPALTAASPAFTAASRIAALPPAPEALSLPPPLQARLDGSPPRGPPALS